MYGIGDNSISLIRNIKQIESVLKIKDNDIIEFFYEIPSKKYKEFLIKTENNYNWLIFYDSIKYKKIDMIHNINLYRRHGMPIDFCPFLYFEKEDLLGIFLLGDLLYFIDIKNHMIIYKYSNTSTSYPSIIYAQKINNKKYFVVENVKCCFGFYSHIYLSDLSPKNISCYEFSTKEIKK
jgi:hypothetical protein